MLRRLPLFLTAFLLVLSTAYGQGLLVGERVALPRPVPEPLPGRPAPQPRPVPVAEYKIKELAVDARVAGQVAQVQVSQTFVNVGTQQMEVRFVFPLPYDGAIDRLTFMVDGKEYEAKLLDAREARSTYEAIVRSNLDPALLEWVGTGMFQTSVFPVPPGAERKVTLRYSQLLRQSSGLTDFLFPLSTAKYTARPVESVRVRLAIENEVEIKNVYSPSHVVDVQRPDDRRAIVTFEAKDTVPAIDFRLLYDVGKDRIGSSLISYRPNGADEGYFLMLASPRIETSTMETPRKTVMFVIDRSGSMAGTKWKQAQEAAKFVLNNLRENDLFNIVAYDGQIESFRPELQRYNDETRRQAVGYVEGLYTGGGTNIDGALRAAFTQLKDDTQPTYLLFLTDGLPTSGETNEARIQANAREHNKVRARVFSFGIGYDVNSRMLDAISRDGFGYSDYIRPNENLEERIGKFYSKIESPVLSEVEINVALDGAKPEDGPAVNRVYPRRAYDLFAGEQLVMVGRYRSPGAAKVTIGGKVSGQAQTYEFPVSLVEKSADESHAFVEKLWALRRVGEIIEEIDQNGQNDELVKELVALATRHGIVTQYTSFLAEEPGAVAAQPGRGVELARRELRALDEQVAGAGGVAQRDLKNSLQRAQNAAAAPAPETASSDRAGGLSGGQNRHFGDDLADKYAQNVKQVAAKTFYRQNDRWVDASVQQNQAEAKPIQIERFSKEFFELVDRHGSKIAPYLAIDEPVTIELDGQVYEF
jgi:Ca-activated chloride channel homolog